MEAIVIIILAVAVSIGLDLILAFPVMWPWNGIMPELFHLPVVTWEQSFCLLVLCSCLFKSSASGGKNA